MTATTATADSVPPDPAARRRTGDPLISAMGVWKIFGPNAERLVGTADVDLPRAGAAGEDRLRRSRARRLVRGLAGRGLRRDGTVGLGQVHARAHADQADRADRGRDPDRRP